MISIIDYGMGNLKSVYNAFKFLGIESKVTRDYKEIKASKGILLPGVGAFPDAMKNLKEYNLDQIILEEVDKDKPMLGICLGMQLLFSKGYEGEECEGLDIIQGEVKKLKEGNIKIPHIGWNSLEINRKDEIMKGLEVESYVYFVHSFQGENLKDENLIAYSNYGENKIPAIVNKDKVYGAQFHPEKSGEVGLKILKNFRELI
ncbi:imidazole glycerol phosphate synthase subunit HisH [Clostridium sp. 'White wine YQ']|uniref:imidazole glycerol phosphate synthase subunit HisH n=1 Tax=Clostridium sp. 'White wine YQ' TaxID=3027474 RepID=UPI00236533AC|nr:imidazole glycerol phosphate synthase subunit HisH [Clostridium sp. 'White wine YQ']MDD7792962.1 imidazole glycerol phosphate synthase subunit HisH [Clostridium sp. 'White wine YQ']